MRSEWTVGHRVLVMLAFGSAIAATDASASCEWNPEAGQYNVCATPTGPGPSPFPIIGDPWGGGGGSTPPPIFSEPGRSIENPIPLPGSAGDCRVDPGNREHAVALLLYAVYGLNCNDIVHKYFEVQFDGASAPGIYQRSDAGCGSSHSAFEMRAPVCD
jgi:hypothetical protein